MIHCIIQQRHKNAIDVARYFLNKVNREEGEAPTHLWVQKMVYYAQAWCLVFLGKALFEDQIEAWKNGPVTRSVWTEFKTYQSNIIPAQPVVAGLAFQAEELKVLDTV